MSGTLFDMAQKVVVHKLDDIDGSEANETIQFGLDGLNYEIDLNDEHAQDLRDALAKFVDGARTTGGKTAARGRRGKAQAGGVSTRVIREWAKFHDIEVNDRGRIPADLVERYNRETQSVAVPA